MAHIRFTYPTSSNYDVSLPIWGYKTTIKPALIHTPILPRGYAIWDNGVSFDQRICECTFLMDDVTTQKLSNVFTDYDKGRGIDITMDLTDAAGFYPFGPDHGDAGSFDVRMLDIQIGASKESPWSYFESKIKLLELSKPAYSLPAEVDEGDDFAIGAVNKLRYPPDFPLPKTAHLMKTNVSYGGVPYTIDKESEEHITILPMVCNQSKAAALIDHLVNDIRDNFFDIVGDDYSYLFGNDLNHQDEFKCLWLNKILEITHTRFDEFSFDLSFYFDSYT